MEGLGPLPMGRAEHRIATFNSTWVASVGTPGGPALQRLDIGPQVGGVVSDRPVNADAGDRSASRQGPELCGLVERAFAAFLGFNSIEGRAGFWASIDIDVSFPGSPCVHGVQFMADHRDCVPPIEP